MQAGDCTPRPRNRTSIILQHIKMKNDLISISVEIWRAPKKVKVRIVIKCILQGERGKGIPSKNEKSKNQQSHHRQQHLQRQKYLGCPVKEYLCHLWHERPSERAVRRLQHFCIFPARSRVERRGAAKWNAENKLAAEIKPGLVQATWTGSSRAKMLRMEGNRKRKISGPIRAYGHMELRLLFSSFSL